MCVVPSLERERVYSRGIRTPGANFGAVCGITEFRGGRERGVLLASSARLRRLVSVRGVNDARGYNGFCEVLSRGGFCFGILRM